ncbi:hypothetical protein [Pseudomonas koreensis]|uniref:Uncharacterized protein n=1 Tax=Pseudomonas koreensis TaxID=198620 RepID=A0A9X3BBN3_9PSED|nr:hypothetical protein [Pseudomonas koreensis]MCU7247248.1 hypothetical protein [Pseudomonas koreensis]
MDEQTTQAFSYTSDALKQMMTLSTGVLALEVTLLKDIIQSLPHIAYIALGTSWVCFLLALLLGVVGMLAVTGSLSKDSKLSPASIYGSNIRIPALFQVIFFGLGMTLTVVFGVMLLWIKSSDSHGAMIGGYLSCIT